MFSFKISLYINYNLKFLKFVLPNILVGIKKISNLRKLQIAILIIRSNRNMTTAVVQKSETA